MADALPLIFKVAPHILEDFGLNLYSDLPRVLVEYVANAHDADSPTAAIAIDTERIAKERETLRAAWLVEMATWKAAYKKWDEAPTKSRGEAPEQPQLESRCLPSDVTITIEDAGCGMARQDLQDKFLIAGRRRRGTKNSASRTAAGRILMGRKGLGKLAGFGVAKVVSVVTKHADDQGATRITLRYDDILRVAETNDIVIEEEPIADGAGFTQSGTRIILSDLLYGPTASRPKTISNRVGDHFSAIRAEEFLISLNGAPIEPTERKFVYAWPQPEIDVSELVTNTYKTEDGREFAYKFRLRFTEPGAALDGKDRGVRVYVHRRLAAAPSLLNANTNMHGFRMTDYLDGVVEADFIDDQPEDYIATDRQSLKWEMPLLSSLSTQLSEAIKKACYARQLVRDEEAETLVRDDPYTQAEIERAGLSSKERTAAVRMGRALASLHKQGTNDEAYKAQFGEVVGAMGRGQILAHLKQMSEDPTPELKEVIEEVTRLTAEQRDGYFTYVKGRIDAIEALKTIVQNTNFKKAKNEKELHQLLESNSWLIDPSFFELVTSNKTEKTTFEDLEKALKVNQHLSPSYDANTDDEQDAGGRNTRPDLVFVLGDAACRKIVIVELKAPNTPLWGEHYRQLQGYVRDTKKWLRRENRKADVSGILIGTYGNLDSRANEVEWLTDQIEQTQNLGEIRVYSIAQLLSLAQDVHHEMIKLWRADDSAATNPSKAALPDPLASS